MRDRLHFVGYVACAIPVEHPQRQKARRPVDSSDASVVQTDRADDTGDMRAVTRVGLVLRDRIVVDEIPAVVQTTGEIQAIELYTGVEDRHRVLGRADGQLPRGRHIDLQERCRYRRYRGGEVPARRRRPHNVGLGVPYPRVTFQRTFGDDRGRRRPRPHEFDLARAD